MTSPENSTIDWDTDLSQMPLAQISSWIKANHDRGKLHTDQIYALFNNVVAAMTLLDPTFPESLRPTIRPFSARGVKDYYASMEE